MAAVRVFVILAASVQIVSGSSDASSNLRAGPAIDAKLADTVRALDTNGNGKVDMSELTSFAKSQGLSSEEILTDFKELDVNHDGALDSSEIGPLFGSADATESFVNNAEATSVAAGPPVSAATTAMSANGEKEVVKATAQAAEVSEPPHTQLRAEKVVPKKEHHSMELDLLTLEHDAQEQAAGAIASRLAQRAQVLLARSTADEHKALAFDVEVRTLRGNATALAQKACEETRQAARAATVAVSQKSLVALKKLQEEEHKSEEAAQERREQAGQAMERVRKAQASLRSS